jgi:hypothetical protein
MSAPQKILDLIATFKNNADHYTSNDYKEAMLRIQFVNPMFKELGWGMENAEGNAPDYQDVIHEASLVIGDTTKAPDYSFGIGRATDKQIDQIVYELYGLTPVEIRIVESGTAA